jgi:hypothetical protein
MSFMPNRRSLVVTYASELVCADPAVLTTLAVFFDSVAFPYPFELDPRSDVRLPVWWNGEFNFLPAVDIYSRFRERWAALFDAGVLHTLPPPLRVSVEEYYRQETEKRKDPKYGHLWDKVLSIQGDTSTPESIYDLLSRTALAFHAVYARKEGPELFMPSPTDLSTERLAGVLARALFQYRIPKLQALNAEQVLEVRSLLKDTKEGFIDYIYEMTDEVEQYLKNETSSESEAALKVVQRKVVPKYDEFRRQLESKRAGFWAKVLAAGGKFFQIDATPLTPKFYAGLFEAVFTSFSEGLEAEWKSNASQAFQYVARLETFSEKI